MAVKRNQVERLSKIIKDNPQPENIALITQLLGELQPVFSDIARVTTLQVQTLAADLHDVAAQAGQAQSFDEDKAEEERKHRYDVIRASLESQAVLPDGQ